MSRISSRLRSASGRALVILTGAAVLLVAGTSFALGANGAVVRVGKRVASTSGETRIIGDSTTYSTRQSNPKSGDGGAAAYGCRASATAAEPCINVFNTRDGRAFVLRSRGVEAGQINVDPAGGRTADQVRPFSTNATGVATGLNADRVDGKSADDIAPKFATVSATGALTGTRGATSSVLVGAATNGTYQVKFASDISKCAYAATETTITDAGAVGVEAADATTLNVRTRAGGGGGGAANTDPAPRPFHLTVTC